MSDSLPEWAASLPAEIHDAPHLAGAESPDQWLAKLKNDSAWRGQSIRVPSEGADDSVLAEFHEQLRSKVPSLMPTPMDEESSGVVYEQMGKPKEAAGYTMPEGVEVANPEEYREAAHALDMTQKVFDRWVQMESAGSSDRNAAIATALEDDYSSLKTEWGAAYDVNYSRVGDILRDAPESIKEAYKAGVLPADQVKWLHSMEGLAEEALEVGGQPTTTVMTPEQASLELDEFKPKFYAMKKHDPGYKAAQSKFERLIKLRMGQAA